MLFMLAGDQLGNYASYPEASESIAGRYGSNIEALRWRGSSVR